MALDVPALRRAITTILGALEREHTNLSELDAKIGDGDLGVTLLKAFRALNRIKDGLPDDLGAALTQVASGVAKASSSSFGTLFATGLIAVAKQTRGQTSTPWVEVPSLLDVAVQAMAARGKASLGDKTVLDAIDAVSRATKGEVEPTAMQATARRAVGVALNAYRDKPNKIGRARVFAEKTIGLDDPGMAAVEVMVSALASA